MRNLNTAFTLLFAMLAALPASAIAAPKATAVTVTAAIAESGDSAGIAWDRSKSGKDAATAAAEAAEDPVYIVKVYVKLPPAGAESHQLWVGEDEVREYGGFKHGLFFKVYNPEQLGKWAGKPLRMGRRGQPAEALGRDFPGEDSGNAVPAAAGARPSRSRIKDVLSE